jgi:glycosyltransferase involved in cell wall biosynthesis
MITSCSVLHISTSDTGGGAAIAAFRLHQALKKQGIDSRMAVKQRNSSDDSIIAYEDIRHRRKLAERLEKMQYSFERKMTTKSVSRSLAYFSDDRVPGPDQLAGYPQADVLNLHWVANFLDYQQFFKRIPRGQALVWTLHDMAPMTGGCHYAIDCNRFTKSCGACPLLGSDNPRDLTRRIHNRKAAALATLAPETTRIVAPSQWLADEARRSTLLGRFDIEVVPNGLDIETFVPRDRRIARDVLGLSQDAHVILFAADAVSDHRKGMDLLLEAIKGIDTGCPTVLAAVGSAGPQIPKGSVLLGRFENMHLMSYVYSAADLFVLPTRADNLPNVLLEAMACGIPCVSFDVGGVRDAVLHQETGLLAPEEDVAELRSNIICLLQDDALRTRMGARSRHVAETYFADIHIAARYAKIYAELIEASRHI